METQKISEDRLSCGTLLTENARKQLSSDNPAPTPLSPAAQGHAATPFQVLLSQAFPQLEILELLGHGGMGVVCKARQTKLERLVALKVLPQSLAADAAFAERFNREARALARLNHPNIVTVYDFGDSGGFFYLLMEFVDGLDLRQTMQTGRLNPQQALLLLPQVCEALQFAHNEGVLHRDIKPANILLDMRGRVKLADFGIAKLLGEATQNRALTYSGVVVGTPHYMAPEQLEHPGQVDQRADIYSLGVVLYEMITGELPLGRFAPPSHRAAVDPRVDEIVLRALEKDREKRFQTVVEFKTSLEAILKRPAAIEPWTPQTAAEVLPIRRAACYFSTPERMRHCFPSPHAHVFQCKGDLRLETEELVFISPWRTRVVMPLRAMRELSIGQFQMWATPWAMKCERIYFLSISFGTDDQPRVVHLTPVPRGESSPALINAQVAEWFEAVRRAAATLSGKNPRVLPPTAVTIHAQRPWRRRVGPLLVMAPVAAWLTGMLNIRSAFSPAPAAPWLAAFLFTALVGLALLWYFIGFFQANQALKSGDLDALTSDEPPGDSEAGIEPYAPSPAEIQPQQPKRPFRWTLAGWAFIVVGIIALIDTLAGLYSRAINQTLYPGIAQLFAGIAIITQSRRWRIVALATLFLGIAATVFICLMMMISPEHGSVSVPGSSLNARASEAPRLAATASVFLAVYVGLPCYLLLSAKGKALFGLSGSQSGGKKPKFPKTAR